MTPLVHAIVIALLLTLAIAALACAAANFLFFRRAVVLLLFSRDRVSTAERWRAAAQMPRGLLSADSHLNGEFMKAPASPITLGITLVVFAGVITTSTSCLRSSRD